MAHRVSQLSSAREFLQLAEPFLLQHECEHNLLLSLAAGIAARTLSSPDVYLAVARDADGNVVGCALRTPPHKLILSLMDERAVAAIARHALEVCKGLHTVLAGDDEVNAFDRVWRNEPGRSTSLGKRQRIYQLDRLVPPANIPAGVARVANDGDANMIEQWITEFQRETNVPVMNIRAFAEQRIASGDLVLWEDREPCALAGVSGRTRNGARIGYVYTPDHLRGRGYASALVAALSGQVLKTKRHCFLFTDLANPTSNRIYQRLGYEPVADVVDLELIA